MEVESGGSTSNLTHSMLSRVKLGVVDQNMLAWTHRHNSTILQPVMTIMEESMTSSELMRIAWWRRQTQQWQKCCIISRGAAVHAASSGSYKDTTSSSSPSANPRARSLPHYRLSRLHGPVPGHRGQRWPKPGATRNHKPGRLP